MTVKELIETLQHCPPDLEVVVNGYEGGYTSKVEIRQFKLQRNVNDAWCYGEHEKVYEGETPEGEIFKAVGICR